VGEEGADDEKNTLEGAEVDVGVTGKMFHVLCGVDVEADAMGVLEMD